jgi:DNA primase
MNKIGEKIIDYYDEHRISYRHIGNNQIQSICPIHNGDNKHAFVINLQTGRFTCYSHNCRRDPFAFFDIYSSVSKDEIKSVQKISDYETKISNEYFNNSFYNNSYLYLYDEIHGEFEDYLINRGITHKNIEEYKIRCCNKLTNVDYMRIIIPIIDNHQRIRNFCMRDISNNPNRLRYKYYSGAKLDMFFGMNKTNLKDYIVLTEGVFDNITLSNHNIPNCLSSLSINLNNYQLGYLIKPSIKGIIFAFDRDEPSLNKINDLMLRIAKTVPDKPLGIMLPPQGFKDWNEARNEDLNKIYQNSKNNMILGKHL